MTHILYIRPGPVPPKPECDYDDFIILSERFSGEVLHPVWGSSGPKVIPRQNFNYHLFYSFKYPSFLRTPLDILFYIYRGLYLHYVVKKFDLIVSYGTNKTGVASAVLKLLTGAKLIVEIPGNPSQAFLIQDSKPKKFRRLKHAIADLLLHISAGNADRIKLLYPTQLNGYPRLNKKPKSIFHALSPVSHLTTKTTDDKFIFFLGSPWFLKGVDVLIKAFHLIKDKHKDYRLIIAGYNADRDYFIDLAQNEKRIEMLPGLPHQEAIDLFARCSIFVLPSRTESMGRVLLEAMALKKPVIGSNVDGIPYVIKDGENGLLFEGEQPFDLAKKIDLLLSDINLYQRLAEGGYSFALNQRSEQEYLNEFEEMAQLTLNKKLAI